MDMPSTNTYDPDAILADPDAPEIHKVYARINIGIRDRGEKWSKCAHCGNPYQLTEAWSTEQICSDECKDMYVSYLNNLEDW